MTSPDMAAPPGTFSAQLLSTLQDVQACGVGKEGRLLIQALAAFGDGITREFYHGFTNVVDAVQAGFDALGEALSGEPGMGGILGFANDIQGTLLGAIELSEVLLGDITEILKQLALGLGCNDVSGPIAENIGQALRDALNKLTAVMRMLFTLIEVIVGIPGATMEDLAAFLSGKWDAIGAVSALAGRIRDMIFEAFGFTPTGDDAADLLGALTSIPQQAVAGLQGALSSISSYVQDLVNAILRAIRGIPVVGGTLADIIAEIGGLQQRAVTAQSTATAAQTDAKAAKSTAQSAVQTTGITTSGTMGDLKWTRLRFTSGGAWTVPSPSAGFRFERFDFQATGAGCGGPRPKTNATEQMPAALAGGFVRRSFTAAEIGPAGTVFNLTVPSGGAAATSTGLGAVGARAVVRRASNNSVLMDSGEPGTSGIFTTAGIPSTDQKPGSGGVGASVTISDNGNGGTTVIANDNAGAGQPTIQTAGGAAGHPTNGWFGGGAGPGNGVDAPTSDPFHSFSGSGAGSSAGGRSETGGKGGDPGGGGGSGSPNNGAGLFPTATNGGPGGRAEICIWIVEAPL